jgi:hypothetical protein
MLEVRMASFGDHFPSWRRIREFHVAVVPLLLFVLWSSAVLVSAQVGGPNSMLAFVKTSNTPSGNVEVHVASGKDLFTTKIIDLPTVFSSTKDGTWQVLLNLDLAFIKTRNTPGDRVELHILSAASDYTARVLDVSTTFGTVDGDKGVWQVLPNRDLALIKTSGTPHQLVEVHIASAESNYQKRIVEEETPYGVSDRNNGVWQFTTNRDMVFIKTQNTPHGHVEIHIAPQDSRYKARGAEFETVFLSENTGVWEYFSNTEVALIKTENTPSGHVEVHTGNSKRHLLDLVTAFANENDGVWSIETP